MGDNDTMEAWGQGDERWIVEDRADGTNVGNWHWTEKDVTKLAKQQLMDAIREDAELSLMGCRFVKVSGFSGFVNLGNRKGKLKVTYSLEVKLQWSREICDNEGSEPSASASGCIKMEEIFDDDPETVFKLDKKTKGSGAEPDRQLQDKLCKNAAK